MTLMQLMTRMMMGRTPCGGRMQGKPQSGQESVREELDKNGDGYDFDDQNYHGTGDDDSQEIRYCCSWFKRESGRNRIRMEYNDFDHYEGTGDEEDNSGEITTVTVVCCYFSG